jgi:hypothetical protein
MKDLDKLALAMPQATKEVEEGRPTYRVHGRMFCFHRSRRPDAVDPETGERLDDVLVFRVADLGVKELLLSDARAASTSLLRIGTATQPSSCASPTSTVSTVTSCATSSRRRG